MHPLPRALCRRQFIPTSMTHGTLAESKRLQRYMEREREVLLLLARESRGSNDRNLCVQLITYTQVSN